MSLNSDWYNVIGECVDSDSGSETDPALSDLLIDVDSSIDKINKDFKNYMNSLKIGHLNARSIPKQFDELNRLVHDTNFDILGISETWLNSGVPDNRVNIFGYKTVRRDRIGARGGGVCFYIADCISFKIIDTSHVHDVPEMLWVEMMFGKCKMAVGVMYRSPKVHVNIFNDLADVINYVRNSYNHCILLGDFNVDMLIDQAGKDYFLNTVLYPCSLSQVIETPTRVTETTESLIDLICVNNSEHVHFADAVDMPGISDHHLIYMAYSFKQPKFKPRVINKRDYRNFSLDAFKHDAEVAHWENVFFVDSLDDKVIVLENVINELLDRHAPCRSFRVTRPAAPWLNSRIVTLMDRRDKLKIKYNKTKRKNPDIFNKYKSIKNRVTSLKRRAKIEFFNDAINKKIKNVTEFWNALKKICVVDGPDQDGKCACSAQCLNDYFLANNNAEVDTEAINNQISSVLNNVLPPTFQLSLVTEFEVLKVLNSLTSKSKGIDGIGADTLKLCTPFIISPLTHIINCSILEQKFPSRWKYANVVPIKKSPNPVKESDYRPISVLPAVSKVIEKLIAYQLINYLNSNNLMYTFQSGFRSNHSTLTALLKITDDIFKAIDQTHITLLILLDYSKAFDTVNHALLLAKMKKFGLHNSTLNWFNSYLSGRCQRVMCNDSQSEWGFMFNGVPQGSVLGPLLFTILVSDLNCVVHESSVHMYADDTQLYHSAPVSNVHQIINTANFELDNISTFSECNGLKLNPAKSMYMFIGTRRNINEINKISYPPLMLNNVPVIRHTFLKNLGITFDEVLSWRKHVNVVVGKSYNKLRMLYRYKNFLSSKAKKHLSESLVLSYFNYCDSLLCNMSLDLQHKIQKVQNACIRFIFGIKKRDRQNLSKLLKQLGWLNMNNRRRLHLLVESYKISNSISAPYLSFNTISNVHTYNTRQMNNIYVPMRRTTISAKSFMSQAPLMFNALPDDIKTQTTLPSFKKKCRSYLFALQNTQ